MPGSSVFDELTSKLLAVLPSSLQNLEKDIQQQFKTILQATFAHMDLVTREEFDIQAKVLARTREKVDMLEKQLDVILNQKT